MSENDLNETLKEQSLNGKVIETPMHDLKNSFAKTDAEKNKKEIIFLGLEWEMRPTKITLLAEQIKEMTKTPIARYFNYRHEYNATELVSIPATLKYHKHFLTTEFFAREYEKIFKVGDGTGIHVHIDKKVFNKTSLKKFIGFICLPENRAFVEAICGRSIGEDVKYCKHNQIEFKYGSLHLFKKKKILKGVKISLTNNLKQVSLRKNTYFPHGKNVAINTDTGLPTVEVRIFQSVTKKSLLLKNLEFVDALVRFSKVAKYRELYPRPFVEFLLNNKEDYKNLLAFPLVKELSEEILTLKEMQAELFDEETNKRKQLVKGVKRVTACLITALTSLTTLMISK